LRENRPGPKPFTMPKAKDIVHTNYKCFHCGRTLASPKPAQCECGHSTVDAINLGIQLAPNPKGEETNPIGFIGTNQLNANVDILYDSKIKKFVIAKHKSKKEEDMRVKEEFTGREFKQVLYKPRSLKKKRSIIELTDPTCSLDADEAKAACDGLCMD